jgi:hypothetical protein
MPRSLRLVARDGCLLAYLFAGSREVRAKETMYASASLGVCSLTGRTLHVGTASVRLTETEVCKVAEAFQPVGLLTMGTAA